MCQVCQVTANTKWSTGFVFGFAQIEAFGECLNHWTRPLAHCSQFISLCEFTSTYKSICTGEWVNFSIESLICYLSRKNCVYCFDYRETLKEDMRVTRYAVNITRVEMKVAAICHSLKAVRNVTEQQDPENIRFWAQALTDRFSSWRRGKNKALLWDLINGGPWSIPVRSAGVK